MVCENCLHRFVCEDRYTIEEQFGCRYYNCKENIIIPELEKIEEELKDSVYLHRDFVFGVINNHIKELKGENNET